MTKQLVFAACMSLLAVQWSGLHLHADSHGYVGTPEAAFTHTHEHHDHQGGTQHDYDDAHDVSLLDIGPGTFKLPLTMLAPTIHVVVVPRVRTRAYAEIAYPVLSGNYTRWRPPLRAPPRSA